MNYSEVYGRMHDQGHKIFSGYSIKSSVADIAELVGHLRYRLDEGQCPRLLDYGSGKGYQYLGMRVHERWGSILPVCYDPGVKQLSERPTGRFNGVICTDVMEHIEEADVPKILDDIFSFLPGPGFAYFYIACRPAKRKKLPDGRDVHVTIKPPVWWAEQVSGYHREDLIIRMRFDEPK